MNNEIIGITVCINYADYFQYTLSNRDLFDRWIVVTDKNDKETQDLCSKSNLEYIHSRYASLGGPIRKGAAINEGILHVIKSNIDHKDNFWLVQMDADCQLIQPKLIRETIKSGLSTENLYTLHGRYNVTFQDLENIIKNKSFDTAKLQNPMLDHVNLRIGYFQCWHTSKRLWYPEESKNAGLDDVLMRNFYGPEYNKILNAIAIHYGEKFMDHDGRVSKRFGE